MPVNGVKIEKRRKTKKNKERERERERERQRERERERERALSKADDAVPSPSAPHNSPPSEWL